MIKYNLQIKTVGKRNTVIIWVADTLPYYSFMIGKDKGLQICLIWFKCNYKRTY